jgi:hypothetical protein
MTNNKFKITEKSIIFASHIPSPDKLFVGKEFLDKFLELFNEHDIYIGVNNSCNEWLLMLDEYSKILNIRYRITPDNFDSGYGVVGAYQTALNLLRESEIEYSIYWFGHTKGSTSNSHNFRTEVFQMFWNKKEIVEEKILSGEVAIYSPYITLTGENYLNTTLPTIIDGDMNDDLSSLYSFWVHNGEVINTFMKNCNPDFFTKDLLKFKRVGFDNSYLDRYFFERDFPMIYQKIGSNKKLLYKIVDGGHAARLRGKTLLELTNNNIIKLED